MKIANLFLSTLKGRLIILMLLGFMPALGFALYHAEQDFEERKAVVEEHTSQAARLISAVHKQMMTGAKEFLKVVSRLPVMYAKNREECKTTLTRLVETFPTYTTFGLIEPNGNIVCSANPIKLRAGVSTLRFFKEATSTRASSIGPYEIDPSTGKPAVYIAMPILDEKNNLHAVIVAGLDLSRFDIPSMIAPLPENSVLVVFGDNGLVLARHPDPEGFSGKYRDQSPLIRNIVTSNLDEGAIQATGFDGINRLYTYKIIHKVPEQKVYLALGAPTDILYARSKEQLYGALFGFALVYLFVAMIVWIGSDILLVRKMNSLIYATERMSSGDFAARTELKNSTDEIGQLARVFDHMADKMQERMREMSKLKEMNDSLQNCLTHEEIVSVVRQFSPQLFPRQSGALYLRNGSDNHLELQTTWGRSLFKNAVSALDCWALRRGKTYSATSGGLEPRCKHVDNTPFNNYACVPLLMHGETLGLLHLQNDSEFPTGKCMDISLPLAESVSEHIALTIAGMKLRERLRTQAIRDGLTGLFNRHHMEEVFNREIRRSERRKMPFAVVMIDIDHFKRFNDTFGHAAGDILLREFGRLLQQQMRAEDSAFRYGGEEFTIVLPAASDESAQAVAEKLRESAQQLVVHSQGRLIGKITISLGVASYPKHGSSWEAVLHAADTALLQAKQTRNRVVVST